ncbi:MAG TPA: dTDP-4-dehydrorhamnose reductase [Candidatus Sulfotelmatobacter sp.]|nr:dTDP-4-dehydrorhamnose reductase [Candidatus Sulfotelmatobacter sp.]
MKVVVIGANGQLGNDVIRSFANNGDEVLGLTHAEIELSTPHSAADCLRSQSPDLVVNTAAMHHVENCELQPDKAYAVNALGSRNLALVTRELNATLMHVSTDYVFDGAKGKPYLEEDAPRPLNVYGNTKLSGEYFVSTVNPKHFILRTSALFGEHPCRAKGGQNFIDLMLRLAKERRRVRVVDSEFVSPTSTRELAQQMVVLSKTSSYGLYHATAQGSCSWYEFAKEIFSAAGITVQLEVASATEFPAKVPRPSYSVLENRRLKAQGLNVFDSWKAGVHNYIRSKSEADAQLCLK